MANVDNLLHRIRSYVQLNQWSKNHLAKKTGVPESTLRNFYKKNWNPAVNTLRKLESVIPSNYRSENEKNHDL